MAEVIAKVTEEAGKVEGGLVELSNGETYLKGRVAAVSNNEFLVDWEDGARTVENQSDYELVVEPRTAAENPAQPAGWAVPPVDADAYPGGELFMTEMQKRNDTAAWEDAQNRAPMDNENPAQPAGWAVPPATNGPIPGQGADGLMMAAAYEKNFVPAPEGYSRVDCQSCGATGRVYGNNPGDGPQSAECSGCYGRGFNYVNLHEIKASVFADDVTGENGLVEITNGNIRVAGKVLAADDSSLIVEWEDERRTVESKADYDLIIRESSEEDSDDEGDVGPFDNGEPLWFHEMEELFNKSGDGSLKCKEPGCGYSIDSDASDLSSKVESHWLDHYDEHMEIEPE